MKGIQINNFFNNHISLNNKKKNPKQPNIFFQENSPQPLASNNNHNNEQLQQLNSYEALTPQMKNFQKQTEFPTRKKRTNTIDPKSTKTKQNRKSKGKKSNSYDKFTRTISLDKGNQRNTDQENQISREIVKSYKKQKSSRNKNQAYQSEGVRRSKSAILKNTNPKTIQSKQISKQFTKNEKKNIILVDGGFKNPLKKQLSKETQNLLKRKQQTQKVQCKTARVESIKIKPRQNKDKIIAQLHKSAQKSDQKSTKYQTQRKLTGVATSKSYFTSAKSSKPVSARDKRPGKKLFENKERDSQKLQLKLNLYKNFEQLIKNSKDQGNSDVKQALDELQQVLQGISSKKDLAKQLKKFTSKLTNVHSPGHSEQSKSCSEEESSTDPFRKIKDFKNNLVKKKLNEDKFFHEPKELKQREVSKKKSSKKLLSKKKKLEDPQGHKKNRKAQFLSEKEQKDIESSNPQLETSEPSVFKNAQEEQSKYINSRNVSQFYDKILNQNQLNYHNQHVDENNEQQSQEEDSQQVLDERNKKYMEFLKSLESQGHLGANVNLAKQQRERNSNLEQQKSSDQIEDINLFLNNQNFPTTRNYNSQKSKLPVNQEKGINPILERRRGEAFPVSNSDISQSGQINYMSEHEQISDQNISDQNDYMLAQIQDLKAFQQQSDKMMQKISAPKPQQRKKNLTIQLNQNHNDLNPSPKELKKPSSPKYDDRYPHLIKSPKFSDIQITNILAVKEKCLASKHQKMNQLVQRMYQKELVSPKSYEYYVYQLKKQFQQESEGIDGFKEQASQILNEINKEKDDIKAIDELIRQQKWEQARRLMKGQHRVPSVFFGFKKNKQKVFEDYNSTHEKLQPVTKPLETVSMTQVVVVSPSKKHIMIQNSVSVTIKPQPSVRKQINQRQIQEGLRRLRQASIAVSQQVSQKGNKKTKNGLTREGKKMKYSDSESDLQNEGLADSLTKQLDFEFDQKFRLRSNDDLNALISGLPREKTQPEAEQYLQTEKADSEDFQHYVYYQSEQAQQISEQKNHEESCQEQIQGRNQQLKQEGMFKLIEVSQLNKQQQDSLQKQQDQLAESNLSDDPLFNLSRPVLHSAERKVIEIDQEDAKDCLVSQQEQEQDEKTQQIEHSGLPKTSIVEEEKDQDSLSDTHSLLQLELRKGFESNLFFIKEYCISLCQYIRDNPEVKNNFKTIISQPLQFDTLDLLRKYRTSTQGQHDDHYNSTLVQLQYKTEFRKPITKAISNQLAKDFNKTYGPLKFWNLDLQKKGRSKFEMEKQAQAIFLSGILEVLNESLDFERPGSIFGKPLLWANKSKHLKNMKYLNGQKTKRVSEDSDESAETYDFIFGVAIARIIQWGSCLCGFLPDTAELQNTEIDDDYVVHIRETRMAFLLEKMLAEQDATFNNSQLQETEIMLYLGKAIAEQLVNEASQQISDIGNFNFNSN